MPDDAGVESDNEGVKSEDEGVKSNRGGSNDMGSSSFGSNRPGGLTPKRIFSRGCPRRGRGEEFNLWHRQSQNSRVDPCVALGTCLKLTCMALHSNRGTNKRNGSKDWPD